MAEIDVFRRLLLPSTLMLLVACWLGGGVTQDDTSIDEWLQLLALPVLAIAAMTLMVDWPKARTVQCGIVVALMVALVPALQLLPLPIGWWSVPAARQAMATDLAQAGVNALAMHWSLSPAATEASLWSMLPALAGFFAALALPARQRRVLVLAIVSIVVINNTIKITVFNRRKEINIMKLVGATNGFIRFPFFVEGVTSGLISAALASGIICGAYYALTRWYAENPSNLSQMFGGQLVPLADVWYYLVGGFALLGFVLCGIGTATSIRKHLNV